MGWWTDTRFDDGTQSMDRFDSNNFPEGEQYLLPQPMNIIEENPFNGFTPENDIQMEGVNPAWEGAGGSNNMLAFPTGLKDLGKGAFALAGMANPYKGWGRITGRGMERHAQNLDKLNIQGPLANAKRKAQTDFNNAVKRQDKVVDKEAVKAGNDATDFRDYMFGSNSPYRSRNPWINPSFWKK